MSKKQSTSRASREERRARKKERRSSHTIDIMKQSTGLKLTEIDPLNNNQAKTFRAFDQGSYIVLNGVAGTGKTFISMYLALKLVENNPRYKKVVIVRSTVPTRDNGFLPGSAAEKTEIYEQAYSAIANTLYGRGDAYRTLKSKGVIEFISTSYVRGTTIDGAVVIVDECQNMTDHEFNSVITRLGEDTRLIICGDICQNDLKKEKTAFATYMKIFARMDNFECIEFNTSDIVRSGFVRDYLVTRHMLEQSNEVPSLAIG